MMSFVPSLVNAVGALLAGSDRAGLAYLDPGSGSFLLQLVIAGLLGAALAVRMSWGRIKNVFRRKSDAPADSGKLDVPPDSEKHGE